MFLKLQFYDILKAHSVIKNVTEGTLFFQMKPRPKAVYHLGTCRQCTGESDVLTIPSNPLDLSLCGDCLTLLISDAAGIGSNL